MKPVEIIVPNRYKDKICIVTASSTGTGLAISKRLAQEGAAVIINSRSKENVQKAVDSLKSLGLNADGVVCNFSNKEQRLNLAKYVAEKYGGIDILVLNAATNMYLGDMIDIPDSMFEKIIDSNIKANFFFIKETFPYMKNRPGRKNILFISTFDVYNPRFPGLPPLGAYVTSKTAIHQMTHFLAYELKKYNIRVNCIAAGSLATRFSQSLRDLYQTSSGWSAKDAYGIERMGTPEDISNTAAFLLSDEAEFIVGEIVVVGGYPSSRL